MRTFLLAIASTLCLAGCTTPQERAIQQQADMDRMIVEYGPACVRLGYPPNSDPWRNCVLHLATKDELYRVGNSPYMYGGWGGRRYWR